MSESCKEADILDPSDRPGPVREIGQPMCARLSGIFPSPSGFIPKFASRESV